MITILASTAYAMAPQGAAGSQGGGFSAFIPLIIMFVIFYFLLIRPQQTKTKKHQELLNSLQRDDMVMTTGGLHGKITGITDTIVTIEVAPNVKVKVARSHISVKNPQMTKPDEKSK